jgi:hypothetical protein
MTPHAKIEAPNDGPGRRYRGFAACTRSGAFVSVLAVAVGVALGAWTAPPEVPASKPTSPTPSIAPVKAATSAPSTPSTGSASSTISATTAAEAEAAPAPASNWVLPIFTDKEGYRSMTLRGSEVRPFQGGVTVTDLNITIFSGNATPVVDSILLSPVARFMQKEMRATGDKSVRFIRDDIEVTGVGWVYDHDLKKISLQQNVRVTFRAQLNDILK